MTFQQRRPASLKIALSDHSFTQTGDSPPCVTWRAAPTLNAISPVCVPQALNQRLKPGNKALLSRGGISAKKARIFEQLTIRRRRRSHSDIQHTYTRLLLNKHPAFEFMTVRESASLACALVVCLTQFTLSRSKVCHNMYTGKCKQNVPLLHP